VGTTVFDQHESTLHWTVMGDAGNNTIYTGSGNDTIYGGAGDDIIHSGAGNDTLVGGEGNNQLHGGDGNDVYVLGLGHDTITDSGGIDTIDVGALSEGIGVFLRRDGNNLVITNGADIRATIVAQFAGTGGAIEKAWSPDQGLLENLMSSLDTTSGNDVITVWTAGQFGLASGDTIDGGAGNDIFFLEDNANGLIILGGDGDDEFVLDPFASSASWHTLDGGAGWDTITINSGREYLSMPTLLNIEEVKLQGDGAFTISSNWGTSLNIVYSSSSQNLYVYNSDDTDIDLSAWTFEDRGTSQVTIDGTWNSSASQTILGSSGNDRITINSGGTLYVHAGDGDDTISVVDTASGYDPVLDTYTYPHFDGGAGINTLDLSGLEMAAEVVLPYGVLSTDAWSVEISNFQNIVGSDYSDRLIGDAGNNTIIGGGGNDWIEGGDGDDVLYAGSGGGMLRGGAGNDVLHGTLGLETGEVSFSFENVESVAECGTDTIYGWKAGDSMSFTESFLNDAHEEQFVFDAWDYDGYAYTRYIEIDEFGDVVDDARAFSDRNGGFAAVQNGNDVEIWYTTGNSNDFKTNYAGGTQGSNSYQIARLIDTDLSQIAGTDLQPGFNDMPP